MAMDENLSPLERMKLRLARRKPKGVVELEREDGRGQNSGEMASTEGKGAMPDLSRRGMPEVGEQVYDAGNSAAILARLLGRLSAQKAGVGDKTGVEVSAGAVCGYDVRRLRSNAG